MEPDALRSHYADHGYARLRGAFEAETAEAMVDAIWDELARRHHVRRDDPATWSFDQPRKLGRLTRFGAFDGVATPAFTEALTALVGVPDWPRPDSWGAPLVTFPTPGPWAVPGGGWHLDWPARGAPDSELVAKWLGYAATVAPGGGATMVIAGSHRLVADYLTTADPADPGTSKTVRAAIFGAHRWFENLHATDPERDERLRAGAVIRGVEVRAVELTGDPGDVVFLHPRLLHAMAPNRGDRPRLMFTGQVIRYR